MAPTPGTAPPDPELDGRLKRLGAKPTEHGPVISVGSLSFDSRRVRLNAGGLRRIDPLVEFLNRYPRRTLRIEGFSDNQGSRTTNDALSRQRAEVVRQALLRRGIGAERLDARGYGEVIQARQSGVVAGHRLDRWVEIVMSNAAGAFGAR